jgi:hypothetical protein
MSSHYENVTETAYETAETVGINPSNQYSAMRTKFDRFFALTHDTLGLASTSETEALKSWIENIAPDDSKEIGHAEDFYRTTSAKQMQSALDLYHGDFLPPLQRAVSAGVISESSLGEWIQWVKDKSRNYKEKELSILNVLPDYLEKRYKIAAKREGVLRSSKFATLEHSSDPEIKSLAAKLSDSDYFLNTLSEEWREKLIVEVQNALPLATSEIKIFAGFEAELDKAVSNGLISASSRKKWIARFKDPTVNLTAKTYFVTSQFPSYVSAWQKVHKERDTVLKDPLMAEVTDKQFKNISTFKDNSKFRALHFDTKEGMVAEARAAIKAHKEGKLLLHKETTNVLKAAVTAGYISSNKVGPWTEHVLKGERTLHELKNFIKGWAKARYRYDQVEQKMLKERVPQGLQRLSEEKFVNLSFEQRISYVEEAERRLHIQMGDPKDTPIQDAKGKVRHALDLENWEEAQHHLAKAWPLATSAEDIAELQSMEKHLRAFGNKSDIEMANDNAEEEIHWAREEIDSVMSLLPQSYQKLYSKALGHGAACLQCVTTCVYNRTWCQERGYLTEGIEDTLREKSIEETADRLSHAGPGHGDGYENNHLDGFHQPAIRTKGIGPQNVFSSSGGADAFVEQANANKNTWSFWYWTNYIDKDVSAGKNSYVAYALNHRIKRAARVLDRHGKTYHAVGPLSSLN